MATAETLICQAYSKPSKVIFMAGQSNMEGRDVDGTSLTSRANDSSIYEYRNIDGAVRNTYLTNYPSGGSIDNFGPNVGALRVLRAAGETNNYVIRYAVGGTACPSFLPATQRLMTPQTDLPDGDVDQSANIVNYFNSATNDMLMRDFRSIGSSVLVWYQGAEDSKYNGSQTYAQNLSGFYETHLTRLIAYLKSSVTNLTGSSAVVIIRSPDWNANSAGSKPYQDTVRAAQVSVATADGTAQWLTSDINQSVTTTWEDSSHIDAASQERLGMDLAAII
tara:strand:- start:697 stop:1530 length:834 start_codon:yes stop_codon:yes gene_type:complete